MKKVLYSLALVLLGLYSCTSWEEPTSATFPAGPSISVNLTAGTPSDSAFVLNITPGEGTYFYSFIIDESDVDETAELDAATLLKGSYGGYVFDATKAGQQNVNEQVDGLKPNTTYQVYAVASSDKGIVGEIAHASITTTDQLAPRALTFSRDADNNAVQLTLSEDVTRGEGAVTAKYYKEWDLLNPVTIDDDITVTISGSKVTFAAPNAPAGSYVCFSYEAGAFVDATGNAVAALNSGINMTTGQFTNLYVRIPTVAFEVTNDNITSPADAFVFSNAEDFSGELTFDFDIFRNDTQVEDGDLSVTYTGESRVATYKLDADDWAVDGSKLTFVLPSEPVDGDVITLNIAEGAFSDVYGNPNAEFSSTLLWKYSKWSPTADDVLGTFTYYLTTSSGTYNLGDFTISEYTGDDAEEGDVIITGLYSKYLDTVEDEPIYGYYNLTSAKLYIFRYQALGKYDEVKDGETTTYGVLTYSVAGQQVVEFDITPDGIVTSDLRLVYSDAGYSQLQGYETPAGTTTFVKKAAAARQAKAKAVTSGKKAAVMTPKGTPRSEKAIRK